MKDILYPLRRLHGRIREFRTIAWPILKARIHNPKAVFLVLTPEHENLGDHAIALAETNMLGKIGVPYIELTGDKLSCLYYTNWLKVMNGRPILINGGGNLGTLWYDVESVTRKIISDNQKSPIYVLPNTFYYEDSPWGKEELEKSIQLYGKHPNLHIYAREKGSYEAMSGIYRNVKLVPDMVLSLNMSGEDQKRDGCLLCLRNDCEKTRTDEDESVIFQQATVLFGEKVRYTDMCVDHSIPIENREKELSQKFDEFRGSSLVITDRLHGMIFCAITGTPCIVIDSKSPKVRGCYEWIRKLDYIRFADNMSQIVNEYYEIPKSIHKYDKSHLEHYYQELSDDILRIL